LYYVLIVAAYIACFLG